MEKAVVTRGGAQLKTLSQSEIDDINVREAHEIQRVELAVWKKGMAELDVAMPRYFEELIDNNPLLVLTSFQQEKYDEKKALRAEQPQA